MYVKHSRARYLYTHKLNYIGFSDQGDARNRNRSRTPIRNRRPKPQAPEAGTDTGHRNRSRVWDRHQNQRAKTQNRSSELKPERTPGSEPKSDILRNWFPRHPLMPGYLRGQAKNNNEFQTIMVMWSVLEHGIFV